MIYNGVDLMSVHPRISIAKEIPPGMAPRTVRTIPTQYGEILAGVDIEQDEYIVRVNIGARRRAEAWEARAALAAWATSAGGNAAQLVPTHWPQVAYDAVASRIDPPEFRFGFGTVDVTFVLPTPTAYELRTKRAAGDGYVLIDVGGSADAEPSITVTAAADSDGMLLTLDNETFWQISGQISTGDVIEISMQQGSLIINGEHAEQRIVYTATRWRPGFSPGRHAIVSSVAGRVEATWHNRWA